MIALIAVVVVSALALWFLDRKDSRHRQERQELVSRIQFPDRMPLSIPRRPREPVERPPDDFHKVGSIDWSEDQ